MDCRCRNLSKLRPAAILYERPAHKLPRPASAAPCILLSSAGAFCLIFAPPRFPFLGRELSPRLFGKANSRPSSLGLRGGRFGQGVRQDFRRGAGFGSSVDQRLSGIHCTQPCRACLESTQASSKATTLRISHKCGFGYSKRSRSSIRYWEIGSSAPSTRLPVSSACATTRPVPISARYIS